MDIDSIKSAMETIGYAISLLKKGKELIPIGKQKEEAEEIINEAEMKFNTAKAQIAKELGYRLHQCTFPPQIMLSIGNDDEGFEQFRCPKCNYIWPGKEPELPIGMRG